MSFKLLAKGFRFYLISTLVFNSLFETLYKTTGAEITATTADSQACPGEELVYTCVSQEGNSLRWRIQTDGILSAEHTFTTGDEQGRVLMKNLYSFILISTASSRIESTVSFIARATVTTEIDCTDQISISSLAVRIAGIPNSPINLEIMVEEYHSRISTVLFAWDAPNGNSRIDYYQYQYQLTNETSVVTYNTTNTSVTVLRIPYNRNVTFSLIAVNCVGSSSSLSKTINVVGCSELNLTSFNINSSMFSQAPRTEVLLPCGINGEEFVNIICQNNGQWLPDPNTLMCSLDPATSSIKNDLQVPTTQPGSIIHSKTFLIPIYILSGMVAMFLCMFSVFIAVCIWKAAAAKQRQKRGGSALSSEVNCTYDEIVVPVHEKIKTTHDSFGSVDVMVTANEAYDTIQFKEKNFSSSDTDMTNNSVYQSKSDSTLLMVNNSCYQNPEQLRFPVATNSKSVANTQLHCYEKHSDYIGSNTLSQIFQEEHNSFLKRKVSTCCNDEIINTPGSVAESGKLSSDYPIKIAQTGRYLM